MDCISLLLTEFVQENVVVQANSQVSLRIMHEEFKKFMNQKGLNLPLTLCAFQDMLIYQHKFNIVAKNVKNIALQSVNGPIYVETKKKVQEEEPLSQLIKFFVESYCSIRADLKVCTKDFVHIVNEYLAHFCSKGQIDAFTIRIESLQLPCGINYPPDTLTTNGKLYTLDTRTLMKILESMYPVAVNGTSIDGIATVFLETKDSNKEEGLLMFFKATYNQVKKVCPNITFHMLPFDLLASIQLKYPCLCDNYGFLTTLVIVASRNNIVNNGTIMKKLISDTRVPLEFSEPLSKWNKMTLTNQWGRDTLDQVYNKYFRFFLGLDDTLLPQEMLKKMSDYSSITFPFTPNFSHVLVGKELLLPKDINAKVKEGKLVSIEDTMRIIGTVGTMRLWVEVMVEILQLSVSTIHIDISDQLVDYVQSLLSRIQLFEEPMELWITYLKNSNQDLLNREMKKLYEQHRKNERIALWITHAYSSLYPEDRIDTRSLTPKRYLETLGQLEYDESRSRSLLVQIKFVEFASMCMEVTLAMMAEGTFLSSLASRFSLTGKKKLPVYTFTIESINERSSDDLWLLVPEVYSVPLSCVDPEDPINDNVQPSSFMIEPSGILSMLYTQISRHY